jgi:sigma-B regulation protein RsbU (phosphoserine phosphatase)
MDVERTDRLVEKRRILQLETLYDLAVALHAHRPEQELADELLQRVCAVLDPAAAVAVTRDPYGGARAVASVGWTGASPDGDVLLGDSLWQELLASGHPVTQRAGELAGRGFEELVAAPLTNRGIFLGYVAVLDKEVRSGESAVFSPGDRRFLESVGALAGVALDSAREVENLEVERDRLEEENKLFKDRFARDISAKLWSSSNGSLRGE